MKNFVFLSNLNKIENYSENISDNHIYYRSLRDDFSTKRDRHRASEAAEDAQKRAKSGTSLAGERLAYKFIFRNKHNANNQMCGFYIKPELCYSSYRYNHETDGRLKVDRVALMGVLGYDLVLKWFVFDVYGGFGLACGNSNKSNYHHGFIGLNADSPTAFTAGFRVGVAF